MAAEGVTRSSENSFTNSSRLKISRVPPGRRPAQQRQIIYQRLGQHAHVAKIGDRGCPVPLGEPFAVAAQNRRKVRKLRHGPAQGLIQRHLLGRIRKMIVAADHVRDLHQRVINHHHVVVDRHPVRTQDDGIAHHFVRELHVAMHDVVKTDGVLGNPQPDGAGLSRRSPPLGFRRIDRAAFAGIDRLAMLGLGPFALLLQLCFGAETQIGFAFIHQALGVFPVDVQALGLAIGRIRPAHVRPFVPVQAQPLEVGDELIFEAGLAAFDVGVFDAQHHGAAFLPGEKPVEQRGTRVADVEMPGWRRRKANRGRERLESPKDVSRPRRRAKLAAPMSRRLSRGHPGGKGTQRHGGGDLRKTRRPGAPAEQHLAGAVSLGLLPVADRPKA